MPKLRINLRELDEIEEQADEATERTGRAERPRDEKGKRPISPLTLQRRQDDRKFGKDIARLLRERKGGKP